MSCQIASLATCNIVKNWHTHVNRASRVKFITSGWRGGSRRITVAIHMQ